SFMLFYALFDDSCDVHDIEHKYILDIHAYPNATFADPRALPLIKSHYPYLPDLPIVQKTTKAIYLIRHPIDVMMSAWDFGHLLGKEEEAMASVKFRAYVRGWIDAGGGGFPEFGTWVQHVRSWLGQSQVPVHFVAYQNLVDRPRKELDDMLKFLGADVSDA